MYMSDYYMLIISSLILLVGVLISVAFLTLLERKVLGYIQIRKGPNKVGYMGIAQPFSDAIKLFSKEMVFPMLSNFSMFYFSPIFNLFLSLILWFSIPFITVFFNFNYGILFILCCSSLGVYTIMIAGWSSNSNYAMLGSMRAIAQTISYEVSLFLILMSFLMLTLSLSVIKFLEIQKYMWLLFFCMPLCVMFFVSMLAETNRTPFDFAEGESELVSGFNIEYSSGGFALIFLAEYSNILFMSLLCVILFLGANFNFIFFLKLTIMSFCWIWVRGTLPRFRYDKLMYMAWKSFLPVALNMLIFYSCMKMFVLVVLL
uniref:NADH-ubiquinone oxidoreductase chain 1 n=1 Tax=Scirtidae sp. BMNH 1274304 TaxID=1796542 RepID=A0A126TF99_9COLE|nr:NADH dehydrogenase subunit 1 [Scirtidae sp. BMNH 1274304]